MDQHFASQLPKTGQWFGLGNSFYSLLLFAIRDRGNRLRSPSRWKIRRGGLPGAVDSASKAKTWCWVSFGIGIVVTVLWFFIGFFAELFANPNLISTIIEILHFPRPFLFVIA